MGRDLVRDQAVGARWPDSRAGKNASEVIPGCVNEMICQSIGTKEFWYCKKGILLTDVSLTLLSQSLSRFGDPLQRKSFSFTRVSGRKGV